jgi:hypothetical protein
MIGISAGVVGILFCLAAAGPVTAGIITIAQPTAGYTGSTTLLTVTAPDNTVVNSLSDPNLMVTFSTGLTALTVPATYSAWNNPPTTETSTPRVLLTPILGATLLTLTFSQPLMTFGLEADPDPLVGTFPMTATFFSGATSLGTINLSLSNNVGANPGAALFAATTTSGPITSMTITATGTDFAIADLRYLLSPPTTSTPEPSTWMVAAIGLAAFGFRKIRSRK